MVARLRRIVNHNVCLPLVEPSARVSMDERDRCLDNVFIERLWGLLKREAVHLRELEDGLKAS